MSKILKASHHFDLVLDEAQADPCLEKDKAKAIIADLRIKLLKAQYAHLKKATQSVLVVITGIDGVGKGGCINMLNEWMDPRHVTTLAYGEPAAHVAQMPYLWRYWQHLPPKGTTGVVFGSWYQRLFEALAEKNIDETRALSVAREIREFEAMLTHNGVQIVKLWFHMSKEAQQKRVDTLLSDPDTAWQVTPIDLEVRKKFDRARKVGALAMTLTQETHAPWVVVPSADENTRYIYAGQAVLAALRRRERILDAALPEPDTDALLSIADLSPTNGNGASRIVSLDQVDYSAGMKKSEYEPLLIQLQARLARLVRDPRFKHIPLILAFEGQDAAGKGGAIRRITHALDARQYRAIPIAAPTDEELARPYLWRFWRRIPERGRIAIFDRSWYGRVLVERVEGFAAEPQWRRAYDEINQFEGQLVEQGAVLLKFWLAITKEEQLERFNDRKRSAFKSFKITPEDWRNRERWDDYVIAANDMFRETSTAACPWHVVSANDKQHARITVLRTIVDALEKALEKHNGNGKHAH